MNDTVLIQDAKEESAYNVEVRDERFKEKTYNSLSALANLKRKRRSVDVWPADAKYEMQRPIMLYVV